LNEFDRQLCERGVAYLSQQALFAFLAICYGMLSIGILLIINDVPMSINWIIFVILTQAVSFCLRYYNQAIFRTNSKQLVFGVVMNLFDAMVIASCLLFVPYVENGVSIYMTGVLLIICLGCPLTSACYKPLLWSFAFPLLTIKVIAWSYYCFKFKDEIFIAALVGVSAEFLLLKRVIATYLSEFKSSIDARNARIEAERATKSKSRFFAASTHDLRQPLAASGALLSVLKIKNKDQELSPLLEKAIYGLNLVDRQIGPLMELARIDSDNLAIYPKEFDLVATLNEIITMSESRLSQNVTIVTNFETPAAICISDENLVKRMVNNIIDNSIKYTEKGTIEISLSVYQTYFKLKIRDTGIGIEKSNLDLILDEFYQIDNLDRNPDKGFGLGLPIVLRICEKLGIKFSIDSEIGLFTEVILVINKASELLLTNDS